MDKTETSSRFFSPEEITETQHIFGKGSKIYEVAHSPRVFSSEEIAETQRIFARSNEENIGVDSSRFFSAEEISNIQVPSHISLKHAFWESKVDDLNKAVQNNNRLLLDAEREYRSHDYTGKASGHLMGVAIEANKRRNDIGIKTGPDTEVRKMRINKFKDVALDRRIDKYKEICANLDNPTSMMGLSDNQRLFAGKKIKAYERAIKAGNFSKADDILERGYSRLDKIKARITGGGNLARIKDIEQEFLQARGNTKYLRQSHAVRSDLGKSIEIEQRSVADTIAKMAKKGIIDKSESDLDKVISTLTPEQIASNENLTTLVEIVNAARSATDDKTGIAPVTKKALRDHMIGQNLSFTHEQLKNAIEAADTHIQAPRLKAKEARDLQQARVDVLRKYIGSEQSPGKLAVLAKRETEMTIDGKRHTMTDLMQSMEDGTLSEEQSEAFTRHYKYLVEEGYLNKKDGDTVIENVKKMCAPEFDPTSIDTEGLDKIIKDKSRTHFWMVVRGKVRDATDGAKSALDKTGAPAAISEAAALGRQKIKTGIDTIDTTVAETFIKANAAFDRAVRETGATQLQSAYHNVKERVVATSSSIMPSVFASATTVKTDVQAKDTGSDVVDFDPITANSDTEKSPQYPI